MSIANIAIATYDLAHHSLPPFRPYFNSEQCQTHYGQCGTKTEDAGMGDLSTA
jgi:hypothetical protein